MINNFLQWLFSGNIVVMCLIFLVIMGMCLRYLLKNERGSFTLALLFLLLGSIWMAILVPTLISAKSSSIQKYSNCKKSFGNYFVCQDRNGREVIISLSNKNFDEGD